MTTTTRRADRFGAGSLILAALAIVVAHPERGFPASFGDLVLFGSLAGDLSRGVKGGYRLTYVAGPPDATGRYNAYKISADPIKPSRYAAEHYFVDQTRVIRFSNDAPADANSRPLN